MADPAAHRPHSSRHARTGALLLVISLATVLGACAPASRTDREAPPSAAAETAEAAPEPASAAAESGAIGEGEASWYGPNFRGRPTANGETFDPAQLTAAHRTLPFGARVRVVNLDNQRSVVVRINDRGPFRKNRIIDLSEAAAREIGLTESGVARVRLEHAGRGDGQRRLAADQRLNGYEVIVPGVAAGTLLVLRGAGRAEAVVRVVDAHPPSGDGLDGEEVFAPPALVERFGPVVELTGL